MEKGREIKLIQIPNAERDVAVAAASILARDKFLWKMQDLSDNYGIEFPRGAGDNVDEVGRLFVKRYGVNSLLNVAKVHFQNTLRITKGIMPEIPESLEDVEEAEDISIKKVPPGESDKIREDLLLECFNLIATFEKELRSFIKSKLIEYYGEEWWSKGISEEIRRKAEKRIISEERKNKKVDLIDGLDFSNYETIICDKKNWKEIFSKIFGDKNNLIARLRSIKKIRDSVAHSRGDFSAQERLELIASISNLRSLMGGQRTLDSFKSVLKDHEDSYRKEFN